MTSTTCPACGHEAAWRLGDGRYKCRACGRRYAWTTAWDAVHLPRETKERLLDYFVLGVPAYRLRFRPLASAPATERFYRLARAACLHVEGLPPPAPGAADDRFVIFGLTGTARHMTIVPLPVEAVDGNWQAYATLSLRGGEAVLRRPPGHAGGREQIDAIDGFWSYVKRWLRAPGSIPVEQFHIHLGEACFRYNHRDRDLYTLLHLCLTSTAAEAILRFLVQIS